LNDKIWVINKGTSDYDKIDLDLKRHVVLKPLRPIQLPRLIAMKYIKRKDITACKDPEKYLQGEPLNRLIIRDAGIGDLLLLEPILRQMAINKNKITMLTRFPAVYENNPYIDKIIQMNSKAEIPSNINPNSWDTYDDLRSYSETCPNRDKKHRTDCYNQIFDLKIDDKEPRLYFSKNEKSILNKKEGYNYIGVACDGSHFFRRYSYGVELINEILNKNKKNIVVILGDGWEDGHGYVKYNKRDKRVIDLQGKTTIRQIINIIRDLDFLISIDTGLLHIGLTLHVPTLGIFSIIDPALRIKYYTGQHTIIYKDDLNCIGCGSWHMAKCEYGDIKQDPDFIPPCLEIIPHEIIEKLDMLERNNEKRIFENEKINVNTINVNTIQRKLVMPIIVLNEEKNLPRFIELVMKHESIGRVIAIDGGSDDRTIDILKKAGAEVYMHYYDKNYHDMQALQRNVSCSFVRDGERIIIMDIDECFSDELSNYLSYLAESDIVYGLLSRRTFDYFDDINNPMKQIKDYPDYQPRFFIWDKCFKWVGSPHHEIYNAPEPIRMRKDIIHFEKEGKDRLALENQWATMQAKSREVYT